MTETIETMGELLGVTGGNLSAAQIDILDGCPGMSAARAALAVVPSKALSDLTHAVGDVLSGVLATPVSEILAGAWNTSESLWGYRDTEKYALDAVFEHPMNEHTLSSTYHPVVELCVNGVAIPKANLTFDVKLSAVIESAVLRIRNARIVGATIGTCRGEASLRCGQAILAETTTHEFSLPTIRFAGGIPIGPGVASSTAPSAT